MKAIIFNFYLVFLTISFSACYNYEAQFEGAYEDVNIDFTPEIQREVVYVAGGNVYLADKYVRDSILIDDSGKVKIASINNDHTKVLFKRSGEKIQVYDIESSKITDEVPNSQDAKWFDYHFNNSTIYYLTTDGILDTYGPEIIANHPLNLRTHYYLNGQSVGGAAILKNGNIVFSLFLGDSFLVLSDGVSVVDSKTVSVVYEYFRLNEAGNRLWVADVYGYDLTHYSPTSLQRLNTEKEYIMGIPASTNTDSGYKITDNNTIQNLEFKLITSPGGKITALDY